jgi:hypothetical protein
MIRIKINTAKIDKTALFEGKNGAKYLDLTLMENKGGTDKYGNDFMCVQDLGAERRKAGERGAILGNAKFVGTVQPSRPAPEPAKFTPGGGHSAAIPDTFGEAGDVPFSPFKF